MHALFFLLTFFGGVSGQAVTTTLFGDVGVEGFADGVGTNAVFNYPNGIAVDQASRLAYIVDSDNQAIRVADLTSLTVTTLVGSRQPGSADGMGSVCQFNNPNGLAIDAVRGILYIADMRNNLIRSVAIAPRVCETLAGGGGTTPPRLGSSDGVGTNALFNNPSSIAVDAGAGILYASDATNNKIRVISLATFSVSTLVGGGVDGQTPGYADGFGTSALFTQPFGVALCAPGLLCLADSSNKLVRTVTLATAQVNTLGGGGSYPYSADGVGTLATFSVPFGILPWQGTDILVTDNFSVRKINLATHTVTTLAGSDSRGSTDGMGTAAGFLYTQGISMYTPLGGNPVALVVDAGNFLVRVVSFNFSST